MMYIFLFDADINGLARTDMRAFYKFKNIARCTQTV